MSMKDVMLEQLAISRRIVTDGHEVVPAWRVERMRRRHFAQEWANANGVAWIVKTQTGQRSADQQDQFATSACSTKAAPISS